jgi:predicted HTH transcriptional regulator
MAGKFDYHDAKPASRDLSEDIAAALREAGSMTRAELRKELGENAETISRNLRR